MTSVTEPTTPPPARRRGFRVLVVIAVLVVAGVATYLLWPTPTLDGAAALDAALPTESDMPGFGRFDGLTGALTPPAGHKSGRTVLTGDELVKQCATYRKQKDAWACADLRGMGWVVLEKSENVFFRVLSTVLAYPDEDASEAAYQGLVADNKREAPKGHEEFDPGLGDESLCFRLDYIDAFAIRDGTVVVEALIWDGSDQVSAADQKAMAAKWPALQLGKIDAAL